MGKLTDIRKRTFLAGSAAILGALYAGALGRGAMKPCGDFNIYPSYSELEPFLRIGRTHLAAAGPAERVRVLRLAPSGGGDPVRAFVQELSRRADAVAADFERDDVVVCQGWLLSRTEVSLCAALAARLG